MSTQYRLVQSGKSVSGGCSAGQGSSEPVAPRKKKPYMNNDKILIIFLLKILVINSDTLTIETE
jgi:hypothetical protein